MTWNPIDDPCDYILLKGKKSPGLAEVVGASSIRDWDVQKGFGLSGAYVLYTGRNLAKFSVKLRLYTRQDWADWYEFKPLVDKLPTRRGMGGGSGKDTGALDIQHPLLEALEIKAVVVAEVLQPVQTEGAGGEWTIEIKMIEFRQPKFALSRPEGAAATEPVDPVEQKINGLFEQHQRLASEE